MMDHSSDLLPGLLCRHFQDETLFLIFIYFRNQFDVVQGKSAVFAGAERDPLNMGQKTFIVPLPDPVLTDPGHFTDLGNAVGFGFFFHYLDLLEYGLQEKIHCLPTYRQVG